MEALLLKDPMVIPNDDLVFSIIGDKSILWRRIISYLHENHKDISEVWRFYNDGKCWLFRTLKKKKTIFWVGIIDGTFRVSFYLGGKAEPLIAKSDLPERIKNEFINDKNNSMFRSITIKMGKGEDAENVIKLIEIKLKLK